MEDIRMTVILIFVFKIQNWHFFHILVPDHKGNIYETWYRRVQNWWKFCPDISWQDTEDTLENHYGGLPPITKFIPPLPSPKIKHKMSLKVFFSLQNKGQPQFCWQFGVWTPRPSLHTKSQNLQLNLENQLTGQTGHTRGKVKVRKMDTYDWQ